MRKHEIIFLLHYRPHCNFCSILRRFLEAFKVSVKKGTKHISMLDTAKKDSEITLPGLPTSCTYVLVTNSQPAHGLNSFLSVGPEII